MDNKQLRDARTDFHWEYANCIGNFRNLQNLNTRTRFIKGKTQRQKDAEFALARALLSMSKEAANIAEGIITEHED